MLAVKKQILKFMFYLFSLIPSTVAVTSNQKSQLSWDLRFIDEFLAEIFSDGVELKTEELFYFVFVKIFFVSVWMENTQTHILNVFISKQSIWLFRFFQVWLKNNFKVLLLKFK